METNAGLKNIDDSNRDKLNRSPRRRINKTASEAKITPACDNLDNAF
jgi:hypothetical protein